MASTASQFESTEPREKSDPGLLHGLWNRQINHYPDTKPRILYLAIVVVASIVLYYQLYIQYAVSTTMMREFGMTYMFATYVSVVGNLAGAFASLLAGLADRWGRANLVVYGLLVTSVLVLFAVPNADSKGQFMAIMAVVSFVEGMVLVATPALIRDFSPQVGRASAMGFWTMGPVLGSLVVTVVTSNTLDSHGWQDQFRYTGYVGLIVFVAALFWLRELSPRIRDQIMVSLRDRALVEAKAKGLDTAKLLENHWKQMMRPNIVFSALGISLHLMFYFSAVGNMVVYFATVHGYSEQRTNALSNWYWCANVIGLLLAGVLSDLTKVRKPFMIFGGVGAIVFTTMFALRTDNPETGYYHFAWLLVGIGITSGFAYAPWMASFTETVEQRNPAATATGLAVWGWTIRIVVSVSAVFTPIVVTSATPLVSHGDEVKAAQADAGPALETVMKFPEVIAELEKYPDAASIPLPVQIQAAMKVGGGDVAKGKAALELVDQKRKSLLILDKDGVKVQDAADRADDEWMRWWWISIGCMGVFLPCVFMMAGRWSPKKAKEDAEAHALRVQEELAALEKSSS